MTDNLCRCGPGPAGCECRPAMAHWTIEQAYRHGRNVVALEPYRYRREWNRVVRQTRGGDDHAA